jgi:hypothetical protein
MNVFLQQLIEFAMEPFALPNIAALFFIGIFYLMLRHQTKRLYRCDRPALQVRQPPGMLGLSVGSISQGHGARRDLCRVQRCSGLPASIFEIT